MAYQAEISRANPTCLIFVLDQSGSMADAFGGTGETSRSKADFLADVTNRTLHDLVLRCSSTEEIKNYYHVAIIGYGSSVSSAFTGALAGRELVPISDVANNPARVENRSKKVPDGAGGLVEQSVRFPVWLDPRTGGGTPMCAALQQTKQIIDTWLSSRKISYPPTVLHITDGESTDGDPSEIGGSILKLATGDGNVLVFNCHVSANRAAKVEYPSSPDPLPDALAKTLFGISSVMPDSIKRAAASIGVNASEGARTFVFNGDPVSLTQFFDIGTRPANLR